MIDFCTKCCYYSKAKAWSWLQLRQLEAQLEEEYDEKRRVMEEKQNLERQLNDMGARAPSHDRGR